MRFENGPDGESVSLFISRGELIKMTDVSIHNKQVITRMYLYDLFNIVNSITPFWLPVINSSMSFQAKPDYKTCMYFRVQIKLTQHSDHYHTCFFVDKL